METRCNSELNLKQRKWQSKHLKKGISLSDALRAFLDKLAATEKVMTKEETWLKEQIEETFSRVEKGEIRYYSEDEADERMNSFISKIEHQHETA